MNGAAVGDKDGGEEIDKMVKDIAERKERIRDLELESEEAIAPRGFARIYTPTKDEYDRHCLTHLPYRNWCPICVQAKRKNPGHYKSKNDRGIPVFSIDYMFLNGKESLANPVIVMTERDSGGIWSIPVKRKGNYSEYVSKRVANIIEKVGYARCVLKSDQEPSIVDVTKEVKRQLWEELQEFAKNVKTETSKVEFEPLAEPQIVLEHSPVGESQSNGRVEGAIDRVKAQIRALKLDVETNYDMKLADNHPIWPWLIEYAGQTLHMFQVTRGDGLTPSQRIRGKTSSGPRARIGDKVLYKMMKTVKADNDTERRWKYGIWQGMIEHTGEHVIGTKEGTLKCRAISQLVPDKRYDAEFFDSTRGTPWKPSPRHSTWRLKTSLAGDEDTEEVPEEDFEVHADLNEDAEEARKIIRESKRIIESKEPITRGFYITQPDIARYGASAGCKGCRFALGRMTYQQAHSVECRKRIMNLMKEDPEDRLRVEQWERDRQLTEEDETDNNAKEIANETAKKIANETAKNPKGPEDQAEDRRPGNPRKRDREEQDEDKITRLEKEFGLNRDYDPNQASSSTSAPIPKRGNDGMDIEEDEKKSKMSRKRTGAKKRGRGEETAEDIGDPRLDVGHSGAINLTDNRQYTIKEKNEILGRVADPRCHMVVTAEGCNSNLNTIVHDIQMNKGKCFIHFQSGGCVATNSSAILWRLSTIAVNQKYIYKAAEILPAMSCQIPRRYMQVAQRKIRQGIEEQKDMDKDQLFILTTIGPQKLNDKDAKTMQETADKCHGNDEQFIAWDDVTGATLRPELVREARMAEMEYFKKMKVYQKVSRSRCLQVTGKGPIGVRWIDVNKQGEDDPLYRSRLVAKDFNNYKDPDLYTATPPLELLRLIISIAASRRSKDGKQWKLMVNDVSRAYFYAESLKPTFVQICDEDFEEGDEQRCGELLVSMYGTRPAAGNWQRCYTEVLKQNEFNTAASSTCIFHHPGRDILVFVHGDDFVSTASGEDLVWLKGVLASKFDIKSKIVGHEENDDKSVKILNRIVTAIDEGFTYEPDIRHAELVVKELGLENAKAVSSPWCEAQFEENAKDRLDYEHLKRYQSISARLNFLALDRMDIQFASKECARKMSDPTVGDWNRLKRIGRYLMGRPRYVLHYEFQEWPGSLVGMSDANWALDKESRKSTSGGIVLHGKHYVKSWSKTQSLVALSSAESELYALIKCTSEILGIKSAMQDWGIQVSGVVKSDASAALGIIQRQGLGKVRHIDCSYLYIQQINAEKVLAFSKVPGARNSADICTKGLAWDKILEFVGDIGGQYAEGRASLASKLQSH